MITQVKFWNKATRLFDLAVLPILAAGEFFQARVTYQNNMATSRSMSMIYRETYTDGSQDTADSGPLQILASGESAQASFSDYPRKPIQKFYVALWANGTMLDWKEFIAGKAPPPPPPDEKKFPWGWAVVAAVAGVVAAAIVKAKKGRK